jgi:hypothetical protein
LIILGHIFTFKHLCLHSITKILRNGPKAHFPFTYAEFSYNNSHHASIKMSPFEALYGRKCQTPLMRSNVGENALEGPAFVKVAE